jgi:hypothetical protein
MRSTYSLLAALLLASTTVASGAITVTGIYGQIVQDQKTGDYSGLSLYVMPSNVGFYVTFRCAAGEIAPPALLKAHIDQGKIRFVVPDTYKFFCSAGTFEGSISDSEIVGRFATGSKNEYVLKKQFSTQ